MDHSLPSGSSPGADRSVHVARDARAPVDDALAWIAAWVAAKRGIDARSIAPDAAFATYGIDSLDAHELVGEIEDERGVSLPMSALFGVTTLRDLASRVVALAAPADDAAVPPAQSEASGARTPTDLRPMHRGTAPLPLSHQQRRMWLLAQLDHDPTAYHLAGTVRLRGALDVAALTRAFASVVARHEALRTTFTEIDGTPTQSIASAYPLFDLPCTIADASKLEDLAAAEHARPFDLETGPLLRARLVQLDTRDHALIVTVHHVAADGWSLGILLRDLSRAYASHVAGGPVALPAPRVQYADYALGQCDWLRDEVLAPLESWWARTLAGAPTTLDLPTDRPRRAGSSSRRGRHATKLAPATLAAVRALAGAEGATNFMVLLAGFALVMGRQAGQRDVVVGTPSANRTSTDARAMVGCFVETLPLRVDLSGSPTFRELLARVRTMALGAYEHQALPFARLLEAAGVSRGRGRTPLFQVMFNLLALDETTLELPGLEAELVPSYPGAAFELNVYAREHAGALELCFAYDADLFDAARIEDLANQFLGAMDASTRAPDARIDAVSLITDRARDVLPDPRVALDAPWPGAVHDVFAREAARDPMRLAVCDATDRWTYGELDARANQLAHALHSAGVSRGDVVAILPARHGSLVWALLGVLKAGAAYTVLDPSYPTARLAACVRTARPVAFVTVANTEVPPALASVLDELGCRTRWALPIRKDPLADPFDAFATTPPAIDPLGADELAVVTFTSGTAGQPRAVAGRHGSLSQFVPWQRGAFGLGRDDRFSMLSGLAHDPLQRDVFTPLQLGASVHVPDAASYASSSALHAWMIREAVTVANLTPALGQHLARDVDASTPPMTALRTVFFIGERLSRHDVARLRTVAPAVACVNLYGATETQRALAYHVAGASPRDVLPLGRGYEGVQLLVVGPGGTQAGIGELGEILVRSRHLAAGYLDDAAQTAARFVVNPFTGSHEDRVYRTGDQGRYLPDGDVEFVGRTDAQVKFHGYRVEPSEIESALCDQPGVREARVVLREGGEGVATQLVAYLAADDRAADDATLRRALLERVPGYMVPSAFVRLASLPTTPNGKLDASRLPSPVPVAPEDAAPRTTVERALAAIWTDVLRAPRPVVRTDNFFALGGDSLTAVEVVRRARIAGVGLKIFHLLEHPTLEAAAAIAGSVAPVAPNRAPVASVASEPFALAPGQSWFVGIDGLSRPSWHMALLIEIPATLSSRAIEDALGVLHRRHDTLRLRFVEATAGLRLSVRPVGDEKPAFSHVNLSRCSAADRDAMVRATAREARATLDPRTGPPMRTVRFHFGPDVPGRLLITVHHAAFDAFSVDLLMAELADLLSREDPTGHDEAPPPSLSFRTWVQSRTAFSRSRALLSELPYWLEQSQPVPALPVDLPEGLHVETAGARHAVMITGDDAARLLREPAVLFERAMAAVTLALAHWSGNSQFAFTLANNGRLAAPQVDAEETLGWLAARHPVRIGLPVGASPDAVQSTVRDALARVPNRGVGYENLRYLATAPEAHALRGGREPEVSLSFVHTPPRDERALPLLDYNFEGDATRSATQLRPNALGVRVVVRGDGVLVAWHYSRTVHYAATIERLADETVRALLAMARDA